MCDHGALHVPAYVAYLILDHLPFLHHLIKLSPSLTPWTSFKVNSPLHPSPQRQVPPLKPTRRLPSPRPPTLRHLLHPLLRLPAPHSTHHPPHPSLFLHLHLPLPLAGLQDLLKSRLHDPHRPTLIPHAHAARSPAFLIAQSTGCLTSDDHLLDLDRCAAGDLGRYRRRRCVCLLPGLGGQHGRCRLAAGRLVGLGERGEERGVQACVGAAEGGKEFWEEDAEGKNEGRWVVMMILRDWVTDDRRLRGGRLDGGVSPLASV